MEIKSPIGRLLSAVRMDNWGNMITGLGKAGKDKRLAATISWTRRSQQELEDLYAQSDTSRRIVDSVPYEALRRGFEIPMLDNLQTKTLAAKVAAARLPEYFKEAWTLGRMHGGAVLMINTRGTSSLDQPLQPQEVFTGFSTFTRWELTPYSAEIDQTPGSENYGRPIRWTLVPHMQSGPLLNQVVHWSRFIFFDGAYLPRVLFTTNGYWHDAILNPVLNAIRNYETSFDAAAALVQDFNVGVWKIKNLAEIVASGNADTIKTRIELANYGKSVLRSVILDEAESYDDKARNVAGMPDLLRLIAGRLVAATDMPHTKLLGESPTGSNATGNSTIMGWYDTVAAVQETWLKPKLMKALRVLDPALPADAEIVFRALWQMDDKEMAAVRYQQAQADDIYSAMGALDAQEIRESRFGGSKYTVETKLLERPKFMAGPDGVPTAAVPGGVDQPGAAPGVNLPKDVVLNGAQVTALTALLSAVAQRQVPVESAIAAAIIGYQITEEQARRILGPAADFTPAPPPGGQPAPAASPAP